jgi:ABC-type sugar transport system ATPase subunit
MTLNSEPILRAEKINKYYPGVHALDDVDFELRAGEVRALLGKNGAGKSTLVKILSGATHADSGQIFIAGHQVTLNNPLDAFRVGIATVYQEMSLVKGLTVAENILLGRWPKQRWLGVDMINRRQTRRLAREALEMMGVKLDLGEAVGRLSVAEQQVVEIAKVVSLRPKVMILDEPTSALPQAEVDHLLALVRRLAENGVAVIYVSHRLQEIPRVADSVTFLRDGRLVATIPIAEATPERVANMIIGGQWARAEQQVGRKVGSKVRLSVQHVSRRRYLHDVSFDLYAGEVLGLAGLLGSGRTELVRAIFGLDPIDSGTIAIDSQVVAHPSPTEMKARGIGLTPEDRKAQGLVLALNVEDNLTLSALDRVSRNQVISSPAKRGLAQKMVEALSIQTPNLEVKALSLSGGNQQKLVVGKWLNSQARILLMDEPTRGIDIQAKEQVYGLVRDLARQGISIIFISSEIEEVLAVADRILVLNQGRIVADIPAAQADLEQILALAMSEEVVL